MSDTTQIELTKNIVRLFEHYDGKNKKCNEDVMYAIFELADYYLSVIPDPETAYIYLIIYFDKIDIYSLLKNNNYSLNTDKGRNAISKLLRKRLKVTEPSLEALVDTVI